jgi:hypothetical protein
MVTIGVGFTDPQFADDAAGRKKIKHCQGLQVSETLEERFRSAPAQRPPGRQPGPYMVRRNKI